MKWARMYFKPANQDL